MHVSWHRGCQLSGREVTPVTDLGQDNLKSSYSDTHTSPCDISGVAVCHFGHQPLWGSLLITHQSSQHRK